MKWKTPPSIKIHEALGVIADQRIEVNGLKGKAYSSSGGKYYSIEYDPAQQAIMLNDNGSYWKGYLGYPGVAFLMMKKVLPFKAEYAEALKDIKWKDINQEFKNDFSKTREYVEKIMEQQGIDLSKFDTYCKRVIKEIEEMDLKYLGKKQFPPKGY